MNLWLLHIPVAAFLGALMGSITNKIYNKKVEVKKVL